MMKIIKIRIANFFDRLKYKGIPEPRKLSSSSLQQSSNSSFSMKLLQQGQQSEFSFGIPTIRDFTCTATKSWSGGD